MTAKLRYIIIRILVLAGVLLTLNYLYKYTLWPSDVHQHADLIDSISKYQMQSDVLFISSSSNYFYNKTDSNKITISTWLHKFYPSLRINAIHKGYLHAGVTESIMNYIDKDSPVKTIIVELNIRSLGSFWINSETEAAYSVQKLMMNKQIPLIFRRFLLSLGYYDARTKEEREKIYLNEWKTDSIYFNGKYPAKTVLDWEISLVNNLKIFTVEGTIEKDKTYFACNLVKMFALQIDTATNVRIKNLDEIVRIAQKRNWNLVFVILPEDFDKVAKMVGEELAMLLDQTADILKKRYQKDGVIVVDNMKLLSSNYFYETYPTEHYVSSGKAYVAENIANALKPLYPDKFNPVTYKKPSSYLPSEEQINKKIECIKNNSDWYQFILKKAADNKVHPDTMIKGDAIWELKKDYIIFPEIAFQADLERTKKMIREYPNWIMTIKEKAEKKGISFEKQLDDDARYLIEND
ncbi:MAG: hypothetical protein A2275_01940 [Bacteroidetes bacterium RIFOXYA12_FULL_35_11]|nr:MAG: hypothetical protein A2X01_16375 [Bacteroidetes bacterium GWF2_35_48]OFY75336.1 MAG: hypothetical protein A2275_01940 [Bacteroidetes bacterium RIFOXYA12_FULL_35_11]OFY94074.1 MAG: hypothetical protein A2491_17165 [Bacteroidetes bacterium RIFOXYC12_FULL_35_7]HBX53462.1 hypothetical protein [Bacteroidales bacterium]